MGHSIHFRGLKPAGFKPASWSNYQSYSNCESNICRACKQWSAELNKEGLCKEEDCIKERNKKALKQGTAIRFVEDLPEDKRIIETQGKCIKV